jgi:enamine deaminase RidA (YjgF/YER057c/UK114 family)
MNEATSVETYMSRDLGRSGVRHSAVTAAGDWIFATGLGPIRMLEGNEPSRAPVEALTAEKRQAIATFSQLEEGVKLAGGELRSLVRFDQFYTTPRAVDGYHQVRTSKLKGRVPPSTSMLASRLLLGGALLDIQAIGLRGDRANKLEFLDDPELNGPSSSGFCAAVRSGEFIFVPGFTPAAFRGQVSRRGIALDASMPEGSQWKGTDIELQTEFLLKRKLAPALELAGGNLRTMVKAQVYLTDADDVLGFLRVWSDAVGDAGPALTIVITPAKSVAIEDARLEINAIAVTARAAASRRVVDGPVQRWFRSAPNAIQVEDLLFMSGVAPLDGDGQVMCATEDSVFGALEDRPYAQTRALLQRAQLVCHAAGTGLHNLLRAQIFPASVENFPAIHRSMQDHLQADALPFSVVEAHAPGPLAGIGVFADLWVHCPQGGGKP